MGTELSTCAPLPAPGTHALPRDHTLVTAAGASIQVPECGCRPDWANGGRGCDPETCLNAAVRIECTPGHCVCGSGCGNQRMQLSQHAPVR